MKLFLVPMVIVGIVLSACCIWHWLTSIPRKVKEYAPDLVEAIRKKDHAMFCEILREFPELPKYNIPDSDQTFLGIAIASGAESGVVESLLRHGADPEEMSAGKTLDQLCLRHPQRQEVTALLWKYR